MRTRLPHRFAIVLALPVLAVIGWRIVALGVADDTARSDPQRALQWRPGHALALSVRGEALADAGQWADAAGLARASVAADPLQARAYRLLARAAEAGGDDAQAYALYRVAARRSPRDVQTRIWLFNRHLTRRDAPAAMADLDALLRARPKLASVLTETIFGMATRPELQPAFFASLQTSPPWRPDVLHWVVRQAPDVEGTARLIELLRRSPGGIEPPIAGAWIERLIGARRFEQAYVQWASGLAPDAREVIGNVFNGSFEHALTGSGFDWRSEPVAGARVDPLPAEGRKGQALRLVFEERRVAFNHLSQLLLLPAGRFRLHGQVRLEHLRSERGLIWTLACAEDGRIVMTGGALRGNAPWHAFSADFEIPENGCRAQWLRLQHGARIASEQRIGGTAWFDDLAISRLQTMR